MSLCSIVVSGKKQNNMAAKNKMATKLVHSGVNYCRFHYLIILHTKA